MAMKENPETVNLRITRKKPKTKTAKKKLVAFKPAKMKLRRTSKKLKISVDKALKTALKGRNVRLKLYKKVDVAIAQDETIKNAIQAIIINVVNDLYPVEQSTVATAAKPKRKRKPRVDKETK